MDFEPILKELKESLLKLFKENLADFKKEGKKDIEAFLDQSKDKLKRWTELLSSGELDLDDFKWLVQSQKDLLLFHALYQTGISRIKVGHLKNKVINTIIEIVSKTVL